MTAQHTPGPWDCKPSNEYSWTYEIEPQGRRGSDNWQEAEANARLIAAAPTMYEYIILSASKGCATAKKIMEAINASS